MISLLAFDSTISGITSELSLLYNLAQLSLAFTLYITTEHEEDALCQGCPCAIFQYLVPAMRRKLRTFQ